MEDYSSSYDDIIDTFFKIYKKTSTVSASSFITSNLSDILFILQKLPLDIDESILTSLITRSLTDPEAVVKELEVIFTFLFKQVDEEIRATRESVLLELEKDVLSSCPIVITTMMNAGNEVFEGSKFSNVILVNAHLAREADCLIPLQYGFSYLFIFENKKMREAGKTKVSASMSLCARLSTSISYSNRS